MTQYIFIVKITSYVACGYVDKRILSYMSIRACQLIIFLRSSLVDRRLSRDARLIFLIMFLFVFILRQFILPVLQLNFPSLFFFVILISVRKPKSTLSGYLRAAPSAIQRICSLNRFILWREGLCISIAKVIGIVERMSSFSAGKNDANIWNVLYCLPQLMSLFRISRVPGYPLLHAFSKSLRLFKFPNVAGINLDFTFLMAEYY